MPDDRRPGARSDPAPGEPRRTWLRRIIGRGPEERRRMAEAVGLLLGAFLAGVAAIGGLVIWHLVRRGRIIRERLGPPRLVRLPDPEDLAGDRRHDDPDHPDDAVPPA